ncbi:MAG: dTMP kinase [Clostridia bacterium]|nr:dTMP kinase [Clostridia bacterium]
MIIVLEGLDNCGKNTIANKLCSKYIDFHKIDFPDYNSDFGQFIKKSLYNEGFSPIALQLLFSSERLSKAQYLKELTRESIIITTRYSYSARAYGAARGINRHLLSLLEEDMPRPNLKIFLKITPAMSLLRSKSLDIIERDITLLAAVNKEYDKILCEDGDWHIVDASQNIDKVFNDVENIIRATLNHL